MISSWRRKRASRATGGGAKPEPAELVIPTHFRCPISLDMMKDPVTLSTGITYDRESIDTWIEGGNKTCPVTKQTLRTLDPVPNHSLRRMIQDWCVENRSHGVERIPTPRVPITSHEVGEILGQISKAQGSKACLELVRRVSKAIKESERNKRCFIANGASKTLALAFKLFADGEGEDVVSLLEEVMIALTIMSPLDSEALGHLRSSGSLARLVWFLRRGGLSGRRSAVLILKELILSTRGQEMLVGELLSIEGTLEGLVQLIKEPVCPASTKASFVVIYNMISTYDPAIARYVELGLVTLILDILVDAEKSICEKALGVLDGLCRSNAGIEAALDHSLTVPVAVKKILRVSDLATEFSVSILWRLSQREEKQSEGVLIEALQVGAFQKLLLILQVGWNINERTREKVTKLLKLLNLYRDRVECIDSLDFQNIKRSF